MRECPDPLQFALLIAQRLDPEHAVGLEEHLRSCPACQRFVADLNPRTEILRSAADNPSQSQSRPADAALPAPEADESTRTLDLHASQEDSDLVPPSSKENADRPREPAQRVRERPLGRAPRPEVPGYELLRLLGQGGMGLVYLARDNQLGRLVALKMVLGGPHAAEIGSLERFRSEAIVVARLHHPNIVQIYDVGEVHGLPYLALEYVPGGSLQRLVAGQPQPPRETARLVAVLARAIQYAHDQGIIHRDLKPANILLAPSSNSELGTGSAELNPSSLPTPSSEFRVPIELATCVPKVTDFGLAKLIGSVDNQTQTGDIVGTPGYLAPEQAEGSPSRTGPAVDVYALGALLYELLTGRPPFQGATALDTILLARLQEPIAPIGCSRGFPAIWKPSA